MLSNMSVRVKVEEASEKVKKENRSNKVINVMRLLSIDWINPGCAVYGSAAGSLSLSLSEVRCYEMLLELGRKQMMLGEWEE